MKIKNFSMNEKRWLFRFVIEGSQLEVFELMERLSIPVMADFNCRKVSEEEFRVSLKCSSAEDYKELYQKIDDIILKYII